ncbi:hypothetical protein BaRGS_00034853 [Batillaria attramentaria]|uniref:Uncharacterized protein n=1 Tax=Batillaria attramentaria TaxID=370345 RepID=A0ABD0JG61_9CAEN
MRVPLQPSTAKHARQCIPLRRNTRVIVEQFQKLYLFDDVKQSNTHLHTLFSLLTGCVPYTLGTSTTATVCSIYNEASNAPGGRPGKTFSHTSQTPGEAL